MVRNACNPLAAVGKTDMSQAICPNSTELFETAVSVKPPRYDKSRKFRGRRQASMAGASFELPTTRVSTVNMNREVQSCQSILT